MCCGREVKGCCEVCSHPLSHRLHQCQRLGSGLKKILEASEQLAVLNEKLEVQKVAVTEKSEACEALLADISIKTTEANEKKGMAEAKGVEIEQQNVVIAKEKVGGCTDRRTQLTKAFVAKTSCNQLLIDSATYLLTINSSTLKSVVMSLYDITSLHVFVHVLTCVG